MKTKIIIISHGMRIGGVERSLIGLLNAFDYEKYDVDLFLYIHDGEFMSLIPKRVNLLHEIKKYTSLLISVRENIMNGYFDILAEKIYASFKSYFFYKKNKLGDQNLVYMDYQQKYTVYSLPKINSSKEYDLAISFMNPHYIAATKVKSVKKIAWIHTDYSFFEFDKKSELNIWGKYDYIASISDSVTDSFLQQFPSLSDKIVLIENILSPNFIREQASIIDVNTEMPKEKDTVSLCSAGRFTHAKNFDNVPFICKKLLETGCNVKWYLIGYGGDEDLIRSKIEETGMQEHVIIIGKKENPYPYMKACDIYVQPSRFEGKAVTVREAQILCKPVVITNFTTSGSQLKNGIDGIIVPIDNDGCVHGIKSLIENKKLQELLIENCRNSDFGNEKEIEKIYSIINK
ncbi:MAG: glycosyltransferase [Bacteroidales bacterium]|jgi:glycosyltransferase involved in cell wall biosynthesis|nr:glycosyltransferase [Bacteroidales bacterium]